MLDILGTLALGLALIVAGIALLPDAVSGVAVIGCAGMMLMGVVLVLSALVGVGALAGLT